MQPPENTAAGTLYIVATPIGNLEDITLRALRILKEVDLIAAEDTRHTRKLLNHFAIHTRLLSYYREKEMDRGREIVARLQAGENVALVSDAGTPGISDPGAVLVRLARQAGIPMVPLPGPSALTTALSVAGLEPGSFLFLGFLPSQKSPRRKILTSLISSEYSLVFYEAPQRIEGLLADALDILGDRLALWARELSKSYEELREAPLSELQALAAERQNKGESVVIIHPGTARVPEGDNMEELLCWYRDHSGLSLKDACRRLAADLGLSRSQIYQQALAIWQDKS
ncbi:16S rRNA (cytidine(1402)-2'-O)-methyltransferase [Desulfoprunum benzoelyticum]|uniref:Ribosomal RNA small subunit methyltransferase I n=1 Tax=Desulfoprunum benzoelyticum TaxID=1506996 RepID=A0A840UTK1_9BACT|nr:16S rRNA (cytidine(1402)-2'-O)-methyltransferase [Desulfoprunum benzoelyticum]MBB5349005.1 16S rRNA (cytidine1402-2'-O)-methyltransferase [Desulfoprunum benzoelyticum]MBM9531791.1 16S rRNA (cytidine(1402)-2'-O)-methyltransferase [Desulfoprunum benzoelyticum]